MAALLVGMAVMAVALSVALPVLSQQAQRERETELVFRGEQYARAIGLYQRKMGPGTLPPTIDVLVEQRFLRKKYKDPITNDDFQPIPAGQPLPAGAGLPGGQLGAPGQPPGRGAAPPAGRGATPATGRTGGGLPAGFGAPGAQAIGGIQGVASKSTADSIRIYNGRQKYNEWAFVYTAAAQAPGVPGGRGADGPGGRGGRAGDGRGGLDGRGGNDGRGGIGGRGGREAFPPPFGTQPGRGATPPRPGR